MGRRGPPPTPTHLKVLRGNPGGKPLNDAEPQPKSDDGFPDAMIVGFALEKWMETVPVLQAMGVWTEADRQTWVRYCCFAAIFKRNYELVELHGDVVMIETKAGSSYPQVSPFATQMFNAAREMLKIETQYGMTPSSRSQVKLSSKAENDPFETYLQRRGS